MLAPAVMGILTLVFVLLAAVVVRVLGTDAGYKALFIAFALLLVLETLF